MTKFKKSLSLIMAVLMLISVMVIAPITASAEADITPPEIDLETLSIELPEGKDVVTAGDTVKYSVKVTDQSSIPYHSLYFKMPITGKDYYRLASYDSETQLMTWSVTIDENFESGVWKIRYFYAEDYFHNNKSVYNEEFYPDYNDRADLSGCDFTVEGTHPDLDSPDIDLETLSMELPEGKDVVTAGDTVKYSVKVTDQSSIPYHSLYFKMPITGKDYYRLASYDSETQLMTWSVTIDENFEPGVWKIRFLYAEDYFHNNKSVYNKEFYPDYNDRADLSGCDFTVEGTHPDLDSPEIDLETLSMELPEGKDVVTAGDTVKYSVKVTDQSSIPYHSLYFKMPITGKDYYRLASYDSETQLMTWSVTIDENFESGVWKIRYLYAEDYFHNNKSVYNKEFYPDYNDRADLSGCDFTVKYPISIVTAESIPDQIATGEQLTPEPVVYDGSTLLEKDKDYTLSYGENIDEGTGTVTVTGIGDYTGEKTFEFNIVAPETEPTQATETSDATDASEPTDSTQTTDATETTEATVPTTPTQATETAEVTEATEVTASTESTQSTEPTVPEAKISKTKARVKAGGTVALKVTDGKVKKWTASNSKVATVKGGKVTALKQGAVTITAILSNGKKLTCKVTVTTSPKLSKKSVSVKKGKTVTVKITGKASAVKNVYTNTKIAKITSKNTATTLTVKGLKKGKTTLKVKVNGVTLKMKVKVK